jgi:hypothetical protein
MAVIAADDVETIVLAAFGGFLSRRSRYRGDRHVFWTCQRDPWPAALRQDVASPRQGPNGANLIAEFESEGNESENHRGWDGPDWNSASHLPFQLFFLPFFLAKRLDAKRLGPGAL